jgi:hypothetical protein
MLINSLYLARISSQLVAYLNKGMTVGEAVNKLRAEYKNVKTLRLVLVGDSNVKLEEKPDEKK